MKGIIIFLVILILAAVVYYFLVYKKSTSSVQAITGSNGGASTSIADISNNYFVNGDDAHDKQVFSLGLACARSFIYKNTNDSMANSLFALNAFSGRGGGYPLACRTEGINCDAIKTINSLNANQTGELLNYISNLNSDNDYKRFSNMAAGKRNMCSVILEESLKNKLPSVWSTIGRG